MYLRFDNLLGHFDIHKINESLYMYTHQPNFTHICIRTRYAINYEVSTVISYVTYRCLSLIYDTLIKSIK